MKTTLGVSPVVGAIKGIRHCVPSVTLQKIYQGLVQTHFDYCSTVLGTCGATLAEYHKNFKQSLAERVLYMICTIMKIQINYSKA